MKNWVQVSVNVPADGLSSFGAMVERWFQENAAVFPDPRGADELIARLRQRDELWRTGPKEQRLRDALSLYRGLSDGAREMLDHLVDHPGARVVADDLARTIGLASRRALAGSLRTFGSKSNKVKGGHRGYPFHWVESADAGGSLYWMEPDVAELFRDARQRLRTAMNKPSSGPD